MSHVNAFRFTRLWKGGDVVSFLLKARPEDFEVNEVSFEENEGDSSAEEPNVMDDAAILRAVDSAKVYKQRHHAITATSEKAGQYEVDEGKDQVKLDLDAQVKLILGEKAYNHVKIYSQNVLESLLKEGFEATKPALEQGCSVDLDDSFRMNSSTRTYLRMFFCTQFPFLTMKVGEGDNVIRIVADKKLMALQVSTGLSVDQWISFALLEKRGTSIGKVTVLDAKGWDKGKRTIFYQLLSRDYPTLQARTCSADGGPDQVIEVRQKKSKKRKYNRASSDDPSCSFSDELKISLFLAFTLVKHNTDHRTAMETVAKALGVPSTTLSYAGMKDRRALTTQRIVAALTVTLRANLARSDKLVASKQILQSAMEALEQASSRQVLQMDAASLCRIDAVAQGRERGVAMHRCRLVDSPMHLGQLRGNRFRLYLRCVAAPRLPELRTELNNAVARGFVNFYGSQRFSSAVAASDSSGGDDEEEKSGDNRGGEYMPLSPRLGEMLLSRKYHKLAGAMLSHLASKNVLYLPASKRLAESSSTYREVLALMPAEDKTGRPSLEKAFLRNLERYGALKVPGPRLGQKLFDEGAHEEVGMITTVDAGNERAHVMAVRMISHFHRSLWVSSYQSWLWNGAVSARVARYGPLPVAGDLIATEVTESESDEGGTVRVISQAELDASTPEKLQELAFRVVVPLFGTSVRVPSWEAEEGGETVPLYPPELTTMSTGDGDKESISAANLPKGAYRTVLAKVSEAVLVETRSDSCEVSFRLPPGSFATSLLSQIAHNDELF